MPEIGVKLANLDKNELLYELNSKDYFFYPYYEGLTSPVSCILSFEYMIAEQSDQSHQFLFGQIFLRKLGLELDIYSDSEG